MQRDLAVPLDAVTAPRSVPGPTPPLAPLSMPVQSLRDAPGARFTPTALRTTLARLIAFGGAVALTVFATREMVAVVSVGRTSALQWLLVGLFAVTFLWIAFAAAAAVAGLLPSRRPRRASARNTPRIRTALVMPVYNEDPASTGAALLAMAEGLIRDGNGADFEIFVLSDTNDPDVWTKETAAFAALRAAVGERMSVWYRRRWRNTGRKAGNVKDFVERWGARYDAMVVLDADSVMAPATLVALAREIAADERLGILQTVPVLACGTGLLARMQQFAGSVYGPIVARGVAAWQGDDGNYWGHNAIIRTRAFAAACGLPVLRGRPPFGGQILSHDFVEAALMRRAGWSVRMEPALGGSWEDGPPSLLDVAVRDRRWAQGNLQHAGVLGARGLRWPSRVHFGMGIQSYVASPLWLAMIAVGVALAIDVALTRPVYFGSPFQLFPDWPRFDAERMIWLFVLTMAVLLLPKLLGVVRVLLQPHLRLAHGGGRAVAASAVCEILLSSLYAPILMLMQTAQLVEILRGRDSGWSAQRRGDGTSSWGVVVRRHALHTVLGIGVAVGVCFASPMLVAWMAPTLLGLALAIPLSKLSGSERAGRGLRERGLFMTPEETRIPKAVLDRDAAMPAMRAAVDGASFATVAADPIARARHFAAVPPPPVPDRGAPDVDRLTARAKLADAASVEEASAWLTRGERLAVLADRAMCEALASPPDAQR